MFQKLKPFLLVVGIPVLYAFLIMFAFDMEVWNDLFQIMSISFLFSLPTIIGILTVYFSKEESVKRLGYRMFMPWVPVFIFFILTILFSLEGWACWIMILPVFLVAASIGGAIGGWLKMRKKDNRLKLTFLVFLPFVISPLEQMIDSIPGTYKAYTYIDINAPKEKIWQNVTRVRPIEASQDKGWLTNFLGFPRPVKAELNYEGVGAYREAVFTNGLVFHETVIEYIPYQKMVFSIQANPYDIPSTTLDEHVVIGGSFFDVLKGTYELEGIDDNTFRLHLYSHFELKTHFNFYASWWGRWIMQDIQQNILQVEKARAESGI